MPGTHMPYDVIHFNQPGTKRYWRSIHGAITVVTATGLTPAFMLYHDELRLTFMAQIPL